MHFRPGIADLAAQRAASMPDSRLAVRLNSTGVRHVRSGHPWVFDSSITNGVDGAAGQICVLFDPTRRLCGLGLWDPHGAIRVRVLHHGGPTVIDEGFFRDRVAAAVARRAALAADPNTNAYRLINGEGDGFGGLIIDRYGDWLGVKVYSEAWLAHLSSILAALWEAVAATDPRRTVVRLARRINHGDSTGQMWVDGSESDGDPSRVGVRENGLRFSADLVAGHKTGLFLDQRDNRAWVGEQAGGRRVLDVFSSTGGFATYAAAGGAHSVTAIDISSPALDVARQNVLANASSVPFTGLVGDAFDELETLAKRGRRFDLVVLDPPAFAVRAAHVDRAKRAYERLGAAGLAVAAPDSLVLFASCSTRIDASDLREALGRGARRAGRRVRVINETHHGADHPVIHPEGAYLKALYVAVD